MRPGDPERQVQWGARTAAMAAPSFPFVYSTVAPAPTALWGANAKAPLPTNAPWLNFALNSGSAPEPVPPYSVRLQNRTAPGYAGIAFGFPQQNVQPAFIIQAFIADLLLTTVEGLDTHTIDKYDDLSVTISWNSLTSSTRALSCPLVRGSPYLTFVFSGGTPSTPNFTTVHAVLNLTASPDKTKHRVEFNNGQTWLIYSSSALPLDPNLTSLSPFSGVIRVAMLPPGGDTSAAEAALDASSPVYPTGGTAALKFYGVEYSWDAQSWSSTAPTSDLLMLSLPVHRRLELETTTPLVQSHVRVLADSTFNPCTLGPTPPGQGAPPPASGSSWQTSPAPASPLSYRTLDGEAQGALGPFWRLKADPLPATWHSLTGLGSADEWSLSALKAALTQDVASLTPIQTSSSYFYGKAVARAARLALIAEELGMSDEKHKARDFLQASLDPWLNGTFPGNAFQYDTVWGGVVPRSGAQDPGADFGAGLYNDHHFHYGYFVYAAAALAKLNPVWARGGAMGPVYSLIRDYLSVEKDAFFPRLRHFDFYALHSWASGLFEFADGRNQESSSECVNAYYAASLWGFAVNDLNLASWGATLAAIETVATETLFHIPDNSTLYPDPFKGANRVLGVLWGNKRDAGLWFASASSLEMRTGIQVIPVTPYTNVLFRDKAFAKQLFTWTEPVLSSSSVTDQWRGLSWAVQAISEPDAALKNIQALTAYDDGNSLTNLLWFALAQYSA